MSEAKDTVIVIGGATATGKSAVACEVARRIDGEIISADSMQVYKYMDIGSAKVTKEEMLGVPHHMIDVTDPDDPMDVSRYAAMASECLRDILGRGKVPVICGGTGFYIRALIRGTDFNDDSKDEGYSAELRAVLEEKGPEALHAMLREVDPASAESIHPNNIKRVIRALEFHRAAGYPISEHNTRERERKSPYKVFFFVINDSREALYQRIDARVDFMMEAGLADEVAYLRAMGLTAADRSMQGIGYKEILSAMDGEYSMEEAVRLIKKGSRNYAKRQMTWFRSEEDTHVVERSEFDGDSIRMARHIISVIESSSEIRAKEVGLPYE